MKRAWPVLLFLSVLANAAPGQPAVQAIRFSQYEDGEATSTNFEFLPGDTVFIRAEFAGYKADNEGKISLDYEISAADPAGSLLAPPVRKKVEAELAPEDKEWTPKLRAEFLIAPTAPSGVYTVGVQVTDNIAKSGAKAAASFKVRGKEVESSAAIVARNFRFLRTEEDGPPLEPAAYRPGDALWARFEMTGYKLGEKNLVHVDYGLAVFHASGEKLFEQAVAAEEKDASFYPKRFVPGTLTLNLDKDIHRAEYTIVLTVRDRLAGQSSESRHVFRVE